MKQEEKLPRMLSKKEVAAILGVDVTTLNRHVRKGSFPLPAKILGRPRWSQTVVEAFLGKKLKAVGQIL